MRTAFPIGIILYLASIGIVATVTAGVLFGIGFSLLVQPADTLGAGAAARGHGYSVGSLFHGLVPNFFDDTVAADAKIVPVPVRTEVPRSTLLAALPQVPVAQPPAADQMPSPEQSGAASPSAVRNGPGSEEQAKPPEAGRPTDMIAPAALAGDPPASATIRAATAVPPSIPAVDPAELLASGDRYLGMGDVTTARLFYERAADAGSRQGAMRLGATFDPNFLGRAGLAGTRGDQAKADMWYRRASGLGTTEAAREPKGRETR